MRQFVMVGFLAVALCTLGLPMTRSLSRSL